MIKVNLLTTAAGKAPARDWFPREQRSAAIGLALLLVTAVGVGGWWYYLRQAHTKFTAEIGVATAELARLKDVAGLVQQAVERKNDLNERLALIQRLRAAMRAPVAMLEIVSRSVPDGLWLTEMKQVGVGVQIEGRAASLSSVTDFTEHLQNSGFFKRPVEIVATTTEVIEEAPVIRFIVKGEVASATPAAPPGTAAPGRPTTPVTPTSSAGTASTAPMAAGSGQD